MFSKYLEVYRQTNNARQFAIKCILYLANFKQIRGHWVISDKLSRDSVILDFGANLGKFSETMRSDYGCNCFLFEANTDLISKIGFPKNQVHNVAITKQDGDVQFNVSDNNEASSLIDNFQTVWDENLQITVPGWSFATVLQKLSLTDEVIDVLKIDIEGAELDLLETVDKSLLSKIAQISVEFHDWINPSLYARTKNVISRMQALGFDGFTDAKSHEEVVEMVFVNRSIYPYSIKQKVVFLFYNLVKYLPERG